MIPVYCFANVVTVEGNATYVIQPTFPMPSCRKLWWSADREALEDNKSRASIESAYTRTAPIVPRGVKRYPSGAGYDTRNRRNVGPVAVPTWNPFA